MSVFSESPYSVKDYPFVIKSNSPLGYQSRLYNRNKGTESNLVHPVIPNANIWDEWALPDISTSTLNSRIANGENIIKLVSKGKILTSGPTFYEFYNKRFKINTLDYSVLSSEWAPRVQIVRIYKEGVVDFKFKIAGANNHRTIDIYDINLGGYIPKNEDFYFLVRSIFDTTTNQGSLSSYDDIDWMVLNNSTSDATHVFFKYYPKQITQFKDPVPSLPGPNTSTISGLSPTPPKADSLLASAQSILPDKPSIPSVPPISSSPSLPSVGNIPSTPTLNSTAASGLSGISSGLSGGVIGTAAGSLSNNIGIGAAAGGLAGGVTGGLTGTGVVSGVVGGAAGGAAGSVIGKSLGGGIGGAVGGLVGGAVVGGLTSKLISKISKWKPYHFSPSSTVKSKVDAVTGDVTKLPSNIPKGLPPISSITSQAPKVDLSSVSTPNISIPSATLPSAPNISIPQSAVPANINVNSISATAGKMSTNVSNSIKGGVNRIQKIKFPKPPTSEEINSKFNNIV